MVKFIKQLTTYFWIGLVAAIFEWLTFFIVNDDRLLAANIYTATFVSFALATLVNWFIGRKSLFRDKKSKWDIIPVFGVSTAALLLNLILMWLFTEVLPFGNHEQMCKISATGIVFIWNFLARKLWVYKI